MAKFEMREWAIKGAEQRLAEMEQETRAILAAFPELRGRARSAGRTAAESETAQFGTAPAGRRRKRSAAARKRMSNAQKARWAKRRAAGTSGQPAGTARADKKK